MNVADGIDGIAADENEKGTKKEKLTGDSANKKEHGKDEKRTARERVIGEMKKEEKEDDDDDDDDDVVVIDSVSTSSGRSPNINQRLYPSIPESTLNCPTTKMDPPPQYGPSSQAQWFSPTSFLGHSSDPSPAGNDQQSTSSVSAGAQRFLSELRQRYQPWSLFFKFEKFGFPPGVAAIGPRIKRNLAAFTANYLCLFGILLLYCVLTSLLMLLSLIVLGGLLYSVYQFTLKGPVLISTYEIPSSLLYSLALMMSIPLFWLADAGSVMYWVLGSGLFLMLSHSTLYASEEVPGSEFEVVTA